MRGKGEQKWRVGWGAVFKVCDKLESYDLASLLADSQPTRHFCSPFPYIGYVNEFLYFFPSEDTGWVLKTRPIKDSELAHWWIQYWKHPNRQILFDWMKRQVQVQCVHSISSSVLGSWIFSGDKIYKGFSQKSPKMNFFLLRVWVDSLNPCEPDGTIPEP